MRYFIAFFAFLFVSLVLVILKSTSFPAKIRKAEEHLEDGEISKANEIVKKILERKSDYVPARYLRALILVKQNQYLLAIAEFNAILGITNFSKYVNEIDIHYQLARLYNETKNWAKEIEEYKAILTFNPEDLTANHRIGHALYNKKDYKRAREHLLKAITIDPTLADVYLPLGMSCFHTSDYERAEEYLKLAIKAPGENAEAKFHLGIIYQTRKDYDNAIAMLSSAKNDRAYTVRALYRIGEIYYNLEEYESAIETLEQGLGNLKEKTEEAYAYRYLLAECYEQENKIKEAVHHWNKIMEDNPAYRDVRNKIESYQEILNNDSLLVMFISSLEALQPTIVELISSLNYNIISKNRISANAFALIRFFEIIL